MGARARIRAWACGEGETFSELWDVDSVTAPEVPVPTTGSRTVNGEPRPKSRSRSHAFQMTLDTVSPASSSYGRLFGSVLKPG